MGETERIQREIFEIFKAVDFVCEKNNLRYYAIGGTCLGAVRHNGFIPWDDDLDIAMPREDYERFLAVAKTQLPSHLEVITPESTQHYLNLFSKVHNINTTFIQDCVKDYSDGAMGIFVDIMPLDGIPDSKLSRRLFFFRIKALWKLNLNRRFEADYFHQGRSLWIWKIIKKLIDLAPYDYYFQKRERIMRRRKLSDTKCSCYGWSYECDRVVFDSKDFEEDIRHPFEDGKIRIPKGYDHFLRSLFGEYMVLPPEEKRVSCHSGYVDLKKSYKLYGKEEVKGDNRIYDRGV